MINFNNLIKEIKFKTSRSGGKGGQHVNKVSTRVELIFGINSSGNLTSEQKNLLFKKLKNKINESGELKIIVNEGRSQLLNKKRAVAKFQKIIENSLIQSKKRIETKMPEAAHLERLKNKKLKSELKKFRQSFRTTF